MRTRAGVSEGSLVSTQVEAFAFITACCRDLVPISALSGAAGTGKSVTLSAAATQREGLGDRVIRISNFVAGPLSLHRVIAQALGVADAGELSVDELEPVLRRALAATGRHEPPVLAIDDAQSLLPETLRYLCLLAGLRDAGRPLFRIILVGRPGFTVRQPIQVQATLEAMQQDASRQTVERLLGASGVLAADDATQEIVRHSNGNLRKIDALARECIEEMQRSSRKRLTFEMVQVAAGARLPARRRRTRMRFQAWMAIPALLAVLVAGYGIVRHDGISRVDLAQTMPPTSGPPAATVPGAATAPAETLPASGAAKVSAPTASPPTAPSQTAVVAPVQPPPANLQPKPARVAQGAAPSSPGPGAGSAIFTEPLPPPLPATSGKAPVATVSPPVTPPLAASSPPDAVPAVPPTPAVPAAVDLSRFRLYNVGACHHGVCPRWSILNLDHQSRSFAGFNPARLGLPTATVQRLREGNLDLIVEGRITADSAGGRVLDAVRLVSVEPHHGRVVQPAAEPDQVPAAEDTQSPPPGYLQPPQGTIRLAPP